MTSESLHSSATDEPFCDGNWSQYRRIRRRRVLTVIVCVLGAVLAGALVSGILPHDRSHTLYRNEMQAIGDLRQMASAQQVYASLNGGYYDRLECLGHSHG